MGLVIDYCVKSGFMRVEDLAKLRLARINRIVR